MKILQAFLMVNDVFFRSERVFQLQLQKLIKVIWVENALEKQVKHFGEVLFAMLVHISKSAKVNDICIRLRGYQ